MATKHLHNVVRHLRTQSEEDRKVFAYIGAILVVVLCIAAWLVILWVRTAPETDGAGIAQSAAIGAIDGEATTSPAQASIDEAIYVRIPNAQQ